MNKREENKGEQLLMIVSIYHYDELYQDASNLTNILLGCSRSNVSFDHKCSCQAPGSCHVQVKDYIGIST